MQRTGLLVATMAAAAIGIGVAPGAVGASPSQGTGRVIVATPDGGPAGVEPRSRDGVKVAGPRSCGTGCRSAFSLGDPHLTTFDGLHYDFQGQGHFILARSTVDDFEVQVRYRLATGPVAGRYSGTDIMVIRAAGSIITVYSSTYLNGNVTGIRLDPFSQSGGRDLPGGVRLKISRAGADATVQLADGTTVLVRWNYGIVRIDLPRSRMGTMEGLLGQADGDPYNDITPQGSTRALDPASLMTPDGHKDLYRRFGTSWVPSAEHDLIGAPDLVPQQDPDGPPDASLYPIDLRRQALEACRIRGWTSENGEADCAWDGMVSGNLYYGFNNRDNWLPPGTIKVFAANAPTLSRLGLEP